MNIINENEDLNTIKNIADKLKVGDKTNFGNVVKRGPNWIEFKAKDTPRTKIDYKQRKIGNKGFILSNLRIIEQVEMREGAKEELEKINGVFSSLKVGDKTNFGKVLKLGDDWVEFKAKDTPKTKIKVNQRKIGNKGFILSKLSIAEGTTNESAPLYKYRHDPLFATSAAVLDQND